MSSDLAIVLAILVVAIVLFVAGRPRSDAVALLVMLLLPLSGTVTYREALDGFSNPNIILIACLFVVGEGLVRTGVAQSVGDLLLRHGGKSESWLVLLVMGAVGLMGAVMSSTAVVAIFIPIVLRISRKSGMASRRILMPMGVAASISGMLTLVATTPNLVLNSALGYAGYTGFRFFDFTPIGAVVLAGGIAYMLFARRLIDAGQSQHRTNRPSLGDWAAKYSLQNRAYRLLIAENSDLVGRQLGVCGAELGKEACVIAIERSSRFARAVMRATADDVLEAGDILLLDMDAEGFDIEAFCGRHLLKRLPVSGMYFADQARDVGMVEVIIPSESRLVGARARESVVLERHGLFIVGLWRGKKAMRKLPETRLRVGDTLLVVGPWAGIFSLQAEEHDLVSLAMPVEADSLVPVPNRAIHALLSLATVIFLMLTDWVPNVMAGLIGALMMGMFGCVTLDVAYRSINWRALILIVGMLPFALALKRSGGVDLAAQFLLHYSGGWGIYGQLALVFLATVSLGIVVSGTATAVLMGPVAISIAENLHASPYAFAMTVAIASSAAFMSPVSTPSNALVSVAGGFGFSDYLKVGTPLTVFSLLVSVTLIPILFPS
ncbi:SLC13 family permease [Achromobacter deleyi]|uniref:SLC13 family permease n=1 Tax=Achromobacter deleyi TaxID=1353891 RepID=UPI0014926B9B|nr:SLC13 family permease [Achromobacter deleyi]QVQ27079.1 SLC13 family permease [Achromobacter deleyi]UIP22664.1 SLC13 family permease [Achromobacter deleyi]